MKKLNKIVSLLLAVLMLFSSFGISAFAEDMFVLSANAKPAYEYDTNKKTLNYLTGEVLAYDENGKLMKDANGKEATQTNAETGKKIVVDTAKERLEYMDLRLEKDGFRLYIDAYS